MCFEIDQLRTGFLGSRAYAASDVPVSVALSWHWPELARGLDDCGKCTRQGFGILVISPTKMLK